MAKKGGRSKVKKSTEPKTKKSIQPKAKKASKPKKRVMAKKASKPKGRVTAIANRFYGTYESTVTGVSALNGTLIVPASGNSNQVAYILDSDPNTTYAVTPNFSSNLISFSFVDNATGNTYSYSSSNWTPSSGASGGEWVGTGDDGADPMGLQGVWKAKT
jgi:hypothetical protein